MKIRKRNNNLLRLERLAQIKLKNFAAAFVAGKPYVEQVNLVTLKPMLANPEIVKLLNGFAYKWQIECSVICRDQAGVEYVVSETVNCVDKYRHSDPDFMRFLNSNHQRLLKECNPLHIITAAWVALPVNRQSLSMDTLDTIYRNMGAFDFMSSYEASKDGES